jgi:hypothetical protein
MFQPIAGVSPPEIEETTVMIVWPTLGATGAGRALGRLYRIDIGFGMFTIGKLIALLSIPLALALFFAALVPPFPFTWPYHRRYTLTNRRVAILADQMSWRRVLRFVPWPKFRVRFPEHWAELDRFDSIEVVMRPGQEWYQSGDLIFRKGAVETLRLEGVSRPETFKRTCLKARMGYVGAQQAVGS